ncbi:unnamed protein product [Acanthoscelides obtectus]|uniref:Uncharacterized protein n=1 Tax=Acanthoscelides obtectus TaxID=200917 RepID=A0A9P0MJE0_ACAOB|nr:unnamed protein product [Acanthoscelides obtectus]CAK1634486.1 SCAN domain-containing protein 3 [Acanthoscelides obtectus]
MVSTHCVIHRQTFASKTLPQKLRHTLDSARRIINYIKSSALNSRLFTLLCEDFDSDHKVLLFHTEVLLFLEFEEKHDFLTMFKYEFGLFN